jgi:DnaK suppressor protein
MSQGLEARQRQKAALLFEALERLNEGRYGVCERCDDTIDVQRLLLFPESVTCSACAA